MGDRHLHFVLLLHEPGRQKKTGYHLYQDEQGFSQRQTFSADGIPPESTLLGHTDLDAVIFPAVFTGLSSPALGDTCFCPHWTHATFAQLFKGHEGPNTVWLTQLASKSCKFLTGEM